MTKPFSTFSISVLTRLLLLLDGAVGTVPCSATTLRFFDMTLHLSCEFYSSGDNFLPCSFLRPRNPSAPLAYTFLRTRFNFAHLFPATLFLGYVLLVVGFLLIPVL